MVASIIHTLKKAHSMSEIFFPLLTMPAVGLSEAGLVDATFLLSRDVITCSAPRGNSYIAHSPMKQMNQ